MDPSILCGFLPARESTTKGSLRFRQTTIYYYMDPRIQWTQTVHRDYIWWWIFDVACLRKIQSNRQGLSVSEESIHTNLPCFIGVANYQDKQDSLAGKWFFWDAFPLYVYLSRFCHFFLFVTVYKLLAVFFQTCLYYLDLWWNRVNILTVPYSRD